MVRCFVDAGVDKRVADVAKEGLSVRIAFLIGECHIPGAIHGHGRAGGHQVAGAIARAADHDALREHPMLVVRAVGGRADDIVDVLHRAQHQDGVAGAVGVQPDVSAQGSQNPLVADLPKVQPSGVHASRIARQLSGLHRLNQLETDPDCAEKHRDQHQHGEGELYHGDAPGPVILHFLPPYSIYGAVPLTGGSRDGSIRSDATAAMGVELASTPDLNPKMRPTRGLRENPWTETCMMSPGDTGRVGLTAETSTGSALDPTSGGLK